MPLSPLRPRNVLGALATGLLVAGAATAAGGPAVHFAPPLRHRLPGASNHRFSQPLVAAGRVDRGRRTDLVAVYAGRLTPLLAHRHGRLVAQRSVRVPSGARHLLVGDVTGDHRSDALVSYGDAFEASDKMSLTVLRGDGRGGFRRERSLRGYGGPIAVGDFNRDGRPDLVVGWAPGGDAALLLGAGAGRFRRPRHLGITKAHFDRWVYTLTAADIDRDGNVDLLVA